MKKRTGCGKIQVSFIKKGLSDRNHRSELEIMWHMSNVLNEELTSREDEKQDGADDLLSKLVAAKLKCLPQKQEYRLNKTWN